MTIEVRFTDVRLLESLLENTTKTVRIKIDMQQASDDDILSLVQLVKDNPGKQPFTMIIQDAKTGMSCNMNPRSLKLNASTLLPLFKKLPYVSFDLK